MKNAVMSLSAASENKVRRGSLDLALGYCTLYPVRMDRIVHKFGKFMKNCTGLSLFDGAAVYSIGSKLQTGGLVIYDEVHSRTNETRWKGLGMLGHSLFLLCFVESGSELRLYAVRKAAPKEKEYYSRRNGWRR
jgi:uncharacterized DUF497 family protein